MMRRRLFGCVLGCALALFGLTSVASAPGAEADPGDSDTGKRLYLVTLSQPGTAAHRGPEDTSDYRTRILAQQDDTLDRVGADEPVYRWTTALNGFAVELDSTQAATLAGLGEVRMVEPEETLTLAQGPRATRVASDRSPPAATGRGTVVGFVDSGIHPDTPAFAASQTLGPLPRQFRGECVEGEDWTSQDCNDKVVGARFFVRGFGEDQLRSGARVSPQDDDGHGTQVASIAAGNAQVTALTDGHKRGVFTGTAPDARIAAYKACWTAPDPADDGCSTADVVAAIDAAVRDRVDVLNLSMSGTVGLDTVDLALLGAAEQDIAVTMAVGNGHGETTSAQPWVTVVGASSGPERRGELRLANGTSFAGVMASPRGLQQSARLVAGADIPAPGRTTAESRLCLPGSLDAARAADKIVLCERGRIARVSKSAAVDLADGAAMVLVNAARKALSADFHAVPTLHVSAREGARLRRTLRSAGPSAGRLVRVPDTTNRARVLPWSAHGRGDAEVVTPSLTSPGFGLLAASAPEASGSSWELLTGTSAATATVSGLAARLRGRHPDWSAARIRSALMTTATPVQGASSLAQGAGVASSGRSLSPGLVFDLPTSAYRRSLEDRAPAARALNLPSALVEQQDDTQVIRRSVTNVGARHMYYSSSARGFSSHRVSVLPAALRIPPGETREFRIRISSEPGNRPAVDSGWVTWRGANGARVRMPVVLAP